MNAAAQWVEFGAALIAAWVAALAALATGQEPPKVSTTSALQPDFRSRLEGYLSDCEGAGHPMRIDETLRTYMRQAYLYDQHVNHGGPLAAPPGKSRHEIGRAADCWPVGVPYSSDQAPYLLDSLAAQYGPKWGLKNLGADGDHDHMEDA